MKELVRFELLKIYRRRIIIVGILTFIILDILQIGLNFYSDHSESAMLNGYRAIYNEAKGPFTEEKINFVVEGLKKNQLLVEAGQYDPEKIDPDTYTGHIYGDMGIFTELYAKMDYAYNYRNSITKVLDTARQNIAFYDQYGNEAAKIRNSDILQRYDNRNISAFYDTVSFTEYFDYHFSTLLILILISLGVSGTFSSEQENGMDMLLKSTKFGNGHTFAAKMVAAMFFTVFISFLFLLTDLLSFEIFYGFDGWFEPLYSIDAYRFTPCRMKIITFFTLESLGKLISYEFFTLLLILFVRFIRRSMTSFLISITLSAAFLAAMTTNVADNLLVFLLFAPAKLLNGSELVKSYAVFLIGGHPVLEFAIALISAAIMPVLLPTLTFLLKKIGSGHFKTNYDH